MGVDFLPCLQACFDYGPFEYVNGILQKNTQKLLLFERTIWWKNKDNSKAKQTQTKKNPKYLNITDFTKIWGWKIMNLLKMKSEILNKKRRKNVKKTKGHICQDCISNEVATHLFGFFSV